MMKTVLCHSVRKWRVWQSWSQIIFRSDCVITKIFFYENLEPYSIILIQYILFSDSLLL